MRVAYAIAALLFLTRPSYASSLSCPRTIRTNQYLVGQLKGWTPLNDEGTSLPVFQRVAFYFGNPKKLAGIEPTKIDAKNNRYTFQFAPIASTPNTKTKTKGKRPPASDYWFACIYTNTKVQVIQRLAKTTRSCTVAYNGNPNNPAAKVTSIGCN